MASSVAHARNPTNWIAISTLGENGLDASECLHRKIFDWPGLADYLLNDARWAAIEKALLAAGVLIDELLMIDA